MDTELINNNNGYNLGFYLMEVNRRMIYKTIIFIAIFIMSLTIVSAAADYSNCVYYAFNDSDTTTVLNPHNESLDYDLTITAGDGGYISGGHSGHGYDLNSSYIKSDSWDFLNGYDFGFICAWNYDYYDSSAARFVNSGDQYLQLQSTYNRAEWNSGTQYIDANWGGGNLDVSRGAWVQRCIAAEYYNSTHYKGSWYINGAINNAGAVKYGTDLFNDADGLYLMQDNDGTDLYTGLIDSVLICREEEITDYSEHYSNDTYFDNLFYSNGSIAEVPGGNINITITHGISGLDWTVRLPTVTFTTNDTIDAAQYKYGDTWREITDLTSPHVFTMQDVAAISKYRGYELEIRVNKSLKQSSIKNNLSYLKPQYKNFPLAYHNIYLNDTMKARYNSLPIDKSDTEINKYRRDFENHDFVIAGESYDYSNLTAGSINIRGEDCYAAAIRCIFEDNVSLGFNSPLGSPTYSCDLANNNLEYLAGGTSGSWDAQNLNLAKAGNFYFHCAATMWYNMTSAAKNSYKTNMTYFLLWSEYKNQQRESTAEVSDGTFNNYDAINRVAQSVGLGINGLLLYNHTISSDSPYCKNILQGDNIGECVDIGLPYGEASDLFVDFNIDSINGTVLFETLAMDYIFGKWPNSDDEKAHPGVYGNLTQAYAWVMMGYDGIAQSGLSYGGAWVRMSPTVMFSLLRDLDTGINPYDWFLERDTNQLLALMEGDRTHYIYQISGNPTINNGNWALSNAGVTMNYLNRVITDDTSEETSIMHDYLKKTSDQDVYNRISNIPGYQNTFLMFLMEKVNSTFETTASTTALTNYNKTAIWNNDGFARVSDNRLNGLDEVIITGGKYNPKSGQFNIVNAFYVNYNNISLISSSGTAGSDSITGVAQPVNGLEMCDPANDNGDDNEIEYYYSGISQNMFMVEGTCPSKPLDYDDLISSEFGETLYNDNISVIEVNSFYDDVNMVLIDSDGLNHERQHITLFDEETLIIIDSLTDTNETHETQFGILLGEGTTGTLTTNNATDTNTFCYDGQCFSMFQVINATYNTHTMSGLGYVNTMEKLVSTQNSNYQITIFIFYSSGEATPTFHYNNTGLNDTFTIVKNDKIINLDYEDSNNLELGVFYTNLTSIYGVSETEGILSYSTNIDYSVPDDLAPPSISGLTVGSIGISSARIIFSTNEGASSKVYYEEFGNTTNNETVTINSFDTSHSVLITGLSSATNYDYNLYDVCDVSGNCASELSGSFTTLSTSVSVDSGNLEDAILPFVIILFLASFLAFLFVFINEDGLTEPKNIVYLIVATVLVLLGAVIISALI